MSLPSPIAVSGATGLVGAALCQSLEQQGVEVRRLVRSRPAADSADIYWKPADGEIDRDKLAGVQAVVHLAGEPIASGRWSPAKKQAIAASRIEGTRLLATTLAGLEPRPGVLVSASAVGFYGDRGSHPVDENSPPGRGFLAETCVAWESETRPAWEAGIRVVQTRTGVVLSPKGGALAMMLTPFKLGLGGVLGDGRQYMSWITLADMVAAIEHCLANEGVAGAVNAVSPHPVTNREFTKTLGRVLGRPTVMRVPAFALRAAVGEMADEALLAGAAVQPTRLLETGYRFQDPALDPALRRVLGE
ncbi:Epimerase family protein [Posidoniimonas polymericola]|uniref:Epimerase family protein n=1 Tax=Posidoniimonas polymericola TaxID=2528002 RepID=A0A5C5ZDR4_9BACT|nr:TIGR01777 family oxidoreductase [Posidoniimonas polymericola]TWT85484.1 Epimerase family protein [Posidoniimonas polymericola]